MTLYGVGLGPGDADLLTVRGREVLRGADVVYSPGRLSRSVATEHVPAERIGDLDFPMTRDEDELRRAWKEAAAEIAPRAREGDVAFVTLGDPNVYSTFGHLRRTLRAFHPSVELDVVPGVSAVTAFATALGVEISAGASLALREASGGAAPTGPDRLVLFKVTDASATHESLVAAGYDVVYGRRLFMEQGETVVTDDPSEIDDRDYYTLAYAERSESRPQRATDQFETAADDRGATNDRGTPDNRGAPDDFAATDDRGAPDVFAATDDREAPGDCAATNDREAPDDCTATDGGAHRAPSDSTVALERSEGELCGDERPRDIGGRTSGSEGEAR